jgi:signal transduction histidine kinase
MTIHVAEQGSRAALLDSQRRVLERIATGAPLSNILDTLVKLIEQQAADMRCAVLIADPGGKQLRFAAAPSIPEDYRKGIEPFLRIEPNMGSCGTAAYLREPVYTQDTATDPRWTVCRDVAVRNGLRAIWSTPILSDDNSVLGTFAMYYGEPRLPSPEHIQLIDMAIQMARVAIQSKLEEERMRASEAGDMRALSRRLVETQETERRELARELHDRVGQNLTGLSINLGILRGHLTDSADAKVRSRLEDSLALLESTASAIAQVSSDLRPPMLDDHGLATTLRWYAQQFSARTGIRVSVDVECPHEAAAPGVQLALFRIAQEALNNVAKHARATKVSLAVGCPASDYLMTISDNGIGFDEPQGGRSKARSGLGMVTMRERAQAVGGQFEVGSLPDHGTRVLVRVPR